MLAGESPVLTRLSAGRQAELPVWASRAEPRARRRDATKDHQLDRTQTPRGSRRGVSAAGPVPLYLYPPILSPTFSLLPLLFSHNFFPRNPLLGVGCDLPSTPTPPSQLEVVNTKQASNQTSRYVNISFPFSISSSCPSFPHPRSSILFSLSSFWHRPMVFFPSEHT
jgi:hypothetical protein